jgi:hypothetical protein
MSIKQWIRNWLNSEENSVTKARRAIDTAEPTVDSTSISINNAINGKVLTLRTYQPNRRNVPQVHSDWVTEYYVIKEGESLTEALTMLLVMRGIDK